jgi:hypothetical protein
MLTMAITVIGFAAGGANAQTTGLIGAGAVPCAKFLADSQTNAAKADRVYYSWAQGYWSGMNVGISVAAKRYKDLKARPADVLLNAMRGYCSAHTQGSYADAAEVAFLALPFVPSN